MSIYQWARELNHKRLKRHQALRIERERRYWEATVADYAAGKIPHYEIRPKKSFPDDKIIWQFWAQGVSRETLPEIVQIAMGSVDRFAGDYRVIRVTEETLGEYVDLPPFIEQLWGEKHRYLSYAYYSDILRLALLEAYGGIWLDATVMLTGPIPERFTEPPFFMYQTPQEVEDVRTWQRICWSMFSPDPKFPVHVHTSFISAHRGNKVIPAMLDLILHHWEKEPDRRTYYLFFNVIFHELVQVGPLREENCFLESYQGFETVMIMGQDIWPRGWESFHELIRHQQLHKLNYKYPVVLPRLHEMLRSEGLYPYDEPSNPLARQS